MTKAQTEFGERQNMQCNVVMLPTEFNKSEDQPGLQTTLRHGQTWMKKKREQVNSKLLLLEVYLLI